MSRLANAWEETAVAATAVPPLHGNSICTVLVVGAGYLGLSAAIHLAEAGADVLGRLGFSNVRALQGPVTITQRGKPRLILMSVEEYNRLRGKSGKTNAFGAPVELSAGHYDPTPEKTQ